MKNIKFKGIFNTSGQNITLYTHANIKQQAYYNFINQLAKLFNQDKGFYLKMFSGAKDNYLITEETKNGNK